MMNLAPMLLAGIFLLWLTGIALLRFACHFIAYVECTPAQVIQLPAKRLLLITWLFISSALLLAGLLGKLTLSEMLRGLFVAAWCLALSALDIARYWLPFSLTSTMGLSGLIFSVFSQERSPISLMYEVTGVLAALMLLRWLINKREQNEVFGEGDVWFLTALVSWFALIDVLLVTLLALASGIAFSLATKRKYLPFGPFLCMFAVLPAFTSMEAIL